METFTTPIPWLLLSARNSRTCFLSVESNPHVGAEAWRAGFMPNYICTTCGTQHAEGDQPPPVCAVCQDDRQYLKVTGQQWTTLDKLRLTHRNSIRFEESGMTGIGVEPHFAI